MSLTVRCHNRITAGVSNKQEYLDVVKGILVVLVGGALVGMMESWSGADCFACHGDRKRHSRVPSWEDLEEVPSRTPFYQEHPTAL